MKFSTFNLLTLLSIGSAFTLNFENMINYKSIELSETKNQTQLVDPALKVQCEASIKKLNCENKDFCKIVKDEKCIELFNKGINELEGCKNYPPKMIEERNNEIKLEYITYKLYCTDDEKGNKCPIVIEDYSNKDELLEINKEEIERVFESTCKSKKCTEATKDFYNEFFKLSDFYEWDQNKTQIMNELKDMINQTLISDKCVKAQVLTSDASSSVKKFGSIMLITISLLLYLLN
ncbi:hypothetical protein BCR32DRAFT_296931 [Anaeromyces robustus]|uniref:Uncharacterized protein n=1 Tax=Anaeromyces robustus TaxID=1754192 RepID=A0A1Y1WPB6_9FUNG|nr:hypothetical protein BCR32DRAFT_296931 [Anaeromyces robustus]|eukprot:ORX75389.1 hypothetical protein BCR32DRAFT_296931 [Anaeromyces robustus]